MPQENQAAPDPLFVKYPDGQVLGTALFVWSAADNKFIPWDGSGGSGGGAVTIADGADVTQGAIADTKVTGDVAGTVNAHLRGVNTSIASVDTKTPALGQALAAASVPIVLTAAQITTLTPPAAITNYALETGGNLQQIEANTGDTIDVLGTTSGAAVVTDANGTVQQYLRGLVKLTSGGVTTMNASSSDGATALTNSAQAIKASAGLLYGYYIYNPNAAGAFVQFYNTASGSVTVGTTNPLFMLSIPPLAAVNLLSPIGITFSNAGWSWAATSTAGGNGALGTALDAIAWYA